MNENIHLNAFRAYSSDTENQLTRGLLILMRVSPYICEQLYKYIFSLFEGHDEQKDLPHPKSCIYESVIIDTQRSSVQSIDAKYLSYLPISDDNFEYSQTDKRERRAIYDGVLAFPNHTIFLFENKPSVRNLGNNQMQESIIGISPNIISLHYRPTLLWQDIIKVLRNILADNEGSPTERALIRDYLSFVDESYPSLNPFDTFAICKDNHELLQKRIKHLVKRISTNPLHKVKWHQGWAWSLIVDLPGIRQIDFRLEFDPSSKRWSLLLHLLFGSLNHEVKDFYKRVTSYEDIRTLHQTGWTSAPIMWLSPYQAGVIAYDDKHNCFPDAENYFKYWKDNFKTVHQYSRKEYFTLIGSLIERQILNLSEERRVATEEKIFSKKYKKINFRPSFVFEYNYEKEQLLELDSLGDIEIRIRQKINEILLPLTGSSLS